MGTGFYVATLILAIIYVIKVRKDVDAGVNTPENFTGQEKLIIGVLCFINPLIFGALFYYSLKSRLPKKAKYANNASFGAVAILIVFFMFVLPMINGA